MACPHSLHGTPSTCSQCIGAVPRKVEQDEDVLLVDGVPVRRVEAPSDGYYPRRKRR